MCGGLYREGSGELLDDVFGNGDRLHRRRRLLHAHGRVSAGGDLRLASRDLGRVPDRAPRLLRDLDDHFELLLEVQRRVELERGGDAREADLAAGWDDAEAGGAPERMLGLF